MLLFPLFLQRLLRRLLSNPLLQLTPELTAWSISLGTCLLHACFTAAVLWHPNASFYLAACLSAIYFLTTGSPTAKAAPT